MTVRTCRIHEKQLQLMARCLDFMRRQDRINLDVPSEYIPGCTLREELALFANVCRDIAAQPAEEAERMTYGIAL